MKYFIGSNGCIDSEVTSDFAFSIYLDHAGKGMRYLVAHPNHNKGVKIYRNNLCLWGENISNRELFRRRLQGKLANEVFGK